MLVWSVFAVLTAMAAIAVLLPYARANRVPIDDGGTDIEVYKDQLQEIDKDLARGALNAAEADAARLEISRRLLKATDLADQAEQRGKATTLARGRVVLITAFVAVPVATLMIYLTYGTPGLPDRPLAQRLEAGVQDQDAAILIAQVEEAVRQNPDDVRGWAILAPIYVRQGRTFDARGAYAQLLRLEGDDPRLLTDLGEVIVIENQGLVTEEAMSRFDEALNLAPDFAKARYYRALAFVQEGRFDEAGTILTALTAAEGLEPALQAGVATLLADMEGAQSAVSLNQPSAQAIAALPESQRREAIEGMVAGLAARLADQPDDLAGWNQLIRSYVTLGRVDEAERSLWTALNLFETDNPARLQLLTIAEQQGLRTTPP